MQKFFMFTFLNIKLFMKSIFNKKNTLLDSKGIVILGRIIKWDLEEVPLMLV
jgi:hypothetical protein